MEEIKLLESMWKARSSRQTTLIVPQVNYDRLNSSLSNEHWAFHVPYGFRDALDIRYDQRVKKKKKYMVWTQGPILKFKEGDTLKSKDGKTSVQVSSANRMGWDTEKNEMYRGVVIYKKHNIVDGVYTKAGDYLTCQVEFLKLLIYGENTCEEITQ
ncbi:hypothetical protein ACJJIU_22275 (plasmid) [Microbulbifer sp. CnH-101-E]|uniref:hypothetical protein n=1 Tax=unclassified Microbulbifer TaxID=2619833 RepID=UPI0040392CFA